MGKRVPGIVRASTATETDTSTRCTKLRHCSQQWGQYAPSRCPLPLHAQLLPEQRREIVAELRGQGHSLRAIAGAVGASKSQVANDLKDCPPVDNQPERVKRQGGGTYPAKRPTIVPTTTSREEARVC